MNKFPAEGFCETTMVDIIYYVIHKVGKPFKKTSYIPKKYIGISWSPNGYWFVKKQSIMTPVSVDTIVDLMGDEGFIYPKYNLKVKQYKDIKPITDGCDVLKEYCDMLNSECTGITFADSSLVTSSSVQMTGCADGILYSGTVTVPSISTTVYYGAGISITIPKTVIRIKRRKPLKQIKFTNLKIDTITCQNLSKNLKTF